VQEGKSFRETGSPITEEEIKLWRGNPKSVGG
jgi:hypothetical protein